MKIHPSTWPLWWIDAAGAAVCVALALAFYLGGAQPLLGRHRLVAAQRIELGIGNSQSAKLETALLAMRQRLEAAKSALKELPLELEPVAGINRRMAGLSDLAADAGLKVDNIQPGQVLAGPYYQTVPIHLAGGGSFPDCTLFLHRLRQTFPDISVQAVECTRGPLGAAPPPVPAPAADAASPGLFKFNLHWHTALSAAGIEVSRADK